MIELELKAVVAQPEAMRAALRRVAGKPTFVGMMTDLRLDRDGALARKGEVLRVRRLSGDDGAGSEVFAWKGPTSVSPEGYKSREELEYQVVGEGSVKQLLEALGYAVFHRIDRHVEIFELTGATARLEWYPEMDTLMEIEGSGEAIEAAIAKLPIAHREFSPEALSRFTDRYTARTGRPARLSLSPDSPRPDHWP